jgi:hypothetical protein
VEDVEIIVALHRPKSAHKKLPLPRAPEIAGHNHVRGGTVSVGLVNVGRENHKKRVRLIAMVKRDG